MFVRTKTTPNSPRKTVQIVESVRDGDKVKQRIVRYVGVAMDEEELKRLLEVAEFIRQKIENEHSPTLFSPEKMAEMVLEGRREEDSNDPININLRDLKEEQRSVVGVHAAYGEIYRQLGFSDLLKPSRHGRAAGDVLKHIVMARIANPSSKRSSVIQIENDFGVSLNLPQVYRMMDKLDDEACERIQNLSFHATRELLGGKVDVIFVDSTTLYFESFTEDEFKKNGYSKDLKFNQPQVLLALIVTKQGLPIGYKAFPGSTYEGHTLLPLLKGLKGKYELDKVVFVADSGLMNADNLDLLDEHGFEYIVGARLKNLNKATKKKILELDSYQACHFGEDDNTKVLEIQQPKNRRLIVSHSERRARKDAHDRQKTVNKILAKLKKSKDPKQLISNYGYKKFVKVDGSVDVALDDEKIAEEAKWDGLHGVVSNAKDLSQKEILSQYRGLWQVEESFRINKHDLRVRPIFHWTPSRVKAHLAIAFMAFACVRHLEYRVALQHRKISPEAIRTALIRVQASVLKAPNGQRYVVPSSASQDARKIYQVMGLRYSTTPYRLSGNS